MEVVHLEEQKLKEFDDNDPLKPFLFALKSLESKRQYPKRLKVFFDFGLDKIFKEVLLR